MMIRSFHQARRTAAAFLFLLLIGLPFIRISGESALRFDVPTLRLHLFGRVIWMEDFFLILLALIFLTFLIMMATTLFGRIWCGWLCPQTILMDIADSTAIGSKRGWSSRIRSFFTCAVLSAAVAAALVGYFVSPYEAPALIREGGLASRIISGSWAALTAILFLDLVLVGRTFCATVCPYAKMQGILFDQSTLTVAFDPRRSDECMHCDACIGACPMGIDIRKGTQIACIHCAECVDACTRQTSRTGRTSLVGYFLGSPGERRAGLRLIPALTGAGAAASLAMLIFVAAGSTTFDMTIRRLEEPPGMAASAGTAARSVLLVVRNKKPKELELQVSAEEAEGGLSVKPDRIVVPPSADTIKIPLTIVFRETTVRDRKIRVIARSVSDRSVVMKEITLLTTREAEGRMP